MPDFRVFVTAMINTVLIVSVARLLLGIWRPDPATHWPALYIGFGFLLGHYGASGLYAPQDMATALMALMGSGFGLLTL